MVNVRQGMDTPNQHKNPNSSVNQLFHCCDGISTLASEETSFLACDTFSYIQDENYFCTNCFIISIKKVKKNNLKFCLLKIKNLTNPANILFLLLFLLFFLFCLCVDCTCLHAWLLAPICSINLFQSIHFTFTFHKWKCSVYKCTGSVRHVRHACISYHIPNPMHCTHYYHHNDLTMVHISSFHHFCYNMSFHFLGMALIDIIIDGMTMLHISIIFVP